MAALYIVGAWLIMQVAEVLSGLLPELLPDWFGQVTIGLLAIGFPIALILSWFYEVTPEGINRDTDEPPAGPPATATGRRVDFIVIAMLCAAVLLFAWDKWWPRGPAEQSIAVLAFDNMSDDPDQEYFSDGIAEEILNALAHIPDLHVTSRSSAFSFKGKNLDIPTIAAQLGVATVLEGSVRRRGSRVRITAQLIDAEVDRHLWSETYDRDIADVFAVQDEISVAIVEALKTRLDLHTEASPRAAVTTSPEAYDELLRGRYLVAQRTPETVQAAVKAFERAVELDPEYALGHAELAIAILLTRINSYGGRPLEEVVPEAQHHVERAMALDPSLAETHLAQGFLVDIDGDFEASIPHYRKAIAINPDYSMAFNFLGVASVFLGDYVTHRDAVERAYRLDPLFIPANDNYLSNLMLQGRLAEADDALEKLAPISPFTHGRKNAQRRHLDGQWADGLEAVLNWLRLYPEHPLPRLYLSLGLTDIGLDADARVGVQDPGMMTRQGRHAEALAIVEAQFASNPEDAGMRLEFGHVLAIAGDFERAKPLLEEAWSNSGGRVSWRGEFRDNNAYALLAILREAGDDEASQALVEALRDDVRRHRDAGHVNTTSFNSTDFEEGFTEFLAGNDARGLELIGRAVEDGYYIGTRDGDAYRRALFEHPGIAPILAMQEARQARERAKFLDMVCSDNPWADVWQPAEETCRQSTAQSGN